MADDLGNFIQTRLRQLEALKSTMPKDQHPRIDFLRKRLYQIGRNSNDKDVKWMEKVDEALPRSKKKKYTGYIGLGAYNTTAYPYKDPFLHDTLAIDPRDVQEYHFAKAAVINGRDRGFDPEAAQQYLNQKGYGSDQGWEIDKGLSNNKGIVIRNEAEKKTRVAFRNTQFNKGYDANLEDIDADGHIFLGTEARHGHWGSMRDTMRETIGKYGRSGLQTTGHSLGGVKSWAASEIFSTPDEPIKSTSFNPWVGQNMANSNSEIPHNIYRTNADFATMRVGQMKGNIKLRTLPTKMGSGFGFSGVQAAHSLDNFDPSFEQSRGKTADIEFQDHVYQVMNDAHRLSEANDFVDMLRTHKYTTRGQLISSSKRLAQKLRGQPVEPLPADDDLELRAARLAKEPFRDWKPRPMSDEEYRIHQEGQARHDARAYEILKEQSDARHRDAFAAEAARAESRGQAHGLPTRGAVPALLKARASLVPPRARGTLATEEELQGATDTSFDAFERALSGWDDAMTESVKAQEDLLYGSTEREGARSIRDRVGRQSRQNKMTRLAPPEPEVHHLEVPQETLDKIQSIDNEIAIKRGIIAGHQQKLRLLKGAERYGGGQDLPSQIADLRSKIYTRDMLGEKHSVFGLGTKTQLEASLAKLQHKADQPTSENEIGRHKASIDQLETQKELLQSENVFDHPAQMRQEIMGRVRPLAENYGNENFQSSLNAIRDQDLHGKWARLVKPRPVSVEPLIRYKKPYTAEAAEEAWGHLPIRVHADPLEPIPEPAPLEPIPEPAPLEPEPSLVPPEPPLEPTPTEVRPAGTTYREWTGARPRTGLNTTYREWTRDRPNNFDNSRFKRLWRHSGGEFTDSEKTDLAHVDDGKTLLSRSELDELANANDPEVHLNRYRAKADESVQKLNRFTTPNEYDDVGVGMTYGGSVAGLVAGGLSAWGTKSGLDAGARKAGLDPEGLGTREVITATTGGAAQGVGTASSLFASGTLGASATPRVLAAETAAGAIGALAGTAVGEGVGYGVDKAVMATGMATPRQAREVAEPVAYLSGGMTAGGTSVVASSYFAGLGTGLMATGAEIDEDALISAPATTPETGGTATAAGMAVGTTLAAIGYGISKIAEWGEEDPGTPPPPKPVSFSVLPGQATLESLKPV